MYLSIVGTWLPALAPASSSDRAQKCLEYFYWHISCSFYKSINIRCAWQAAKWFWFLFGSSGERWFRNRLASIYQHLSVLYKYIYIHIHIHTYMHMCSSQGLTTQFFGRVEILMFFTQVKNVFIIFLWYVELISLKRKSIDLFVCSK